MKLWLLRTACLSFFVALAGCSPQFAGIESSVDRNGEEIARMRDDQMLIRQELESISRLLKADNGSGENQDVRVQTRLAQLDRKIEQLLRLQQDNAEYVRGLSARVDLLTTRLGVPTIGEYKTVDDDPAGDGLDVLPEEGQSLFDAAKLDRNRGNDDLAREGFNDFLTRYPRSELADEALYWLGEMAYARGDYAEALDKLGLLVAEHPQSMLRADALMKQIFCHQGLGQNDRAQEMLLRLQTEFPDSEQAALAAAGLGEGE